MSAVCRRSIVQETGGRTTLQVPLSICVPEPLRGVIRSVASGRVGQVQVRPAQIEVFHEAGGAECAYV